MESADDVTSAPFNFYTNGLLILSICPICSTLIILEA